MPIIAGQSRVFLDFLELYRFHWMCCCVPYLKKLFLRGKLVPKIITKHLDFQRFVPVFYYFHWGWSHASSTHREDTGRPRNKNWSGVGVRDIRDPGFQCWSLISKSLVFLRWHHQIAAWDHMFLLFLREWNMWNSSKIIEQYVFSTNGWGLMGPWWEIILSSLSFQVHNVHTPFDYSSYLEIIKLFGCPPHPSQGTSVVAGRNMFAKQPRASTPTRRSGSGQNCPASWSGSAPTWSLCCGTCLSSSAGLMFSQQTGSARQTICCHPNRTGVSLELQWMQRIHFINQTCLAITVAFPSNIENIHPWLSWLYRCIACIAETCWRISLATSSKIVAAGNFWAAILVTRVSTSLGRPCGSRGLWMWPQLMLVGFCICIVAKRI